MESINNNNKILENDIILSNFVVQNKLYNNYEYDSNGNMTKIETYNESLLFPSFPATLAKRNLYWNVEDQLLAMID
ncbi:MAG: hypothetical protein M0P36_09640, partial [Bacteroidales bacterium]|nr:hypothetical protein [Bacteroidales bacterium]